MDGDFDESGDEVDGKFSSEVLRALALTKHNVNVIERYLRLPFWI